VLIRFGCGLDSKIYGISIGLYTSPGMEAIKTLSGSSYTS